MEDRRQEVREEGGGRNRTAGPVGGRAGRSVAGRGVAGLLDRLSYANVTATLALLVALGGTATAATTLTRDSVGAAQIRKDAVRSPEIRADAVRGPEIQKDAVGSSEIQKDAVRSPEIQKDAVRSSEIRNESIFLTDIAPGARAALARPSVRLAEDDNADVPSCSGPLTACSNLISLRLSSGNWLVQAKFVMRNNGNPSITSPICGLVQNDATVVDEAGMESLDVRSTAGSSEAVALTDVLTGVPGNTTVALRCIRGSGEPLVLDDMRITALEVGSVTGP